MKQQHKAIIADLANQHGRQVFHSAFRLLSDAHLAEDVTQEVFLKLFKKPPSAFDNISNWPGYLTSMAISTSIDYLRRNKRLAEDNFDDIPEQADNNSQRPLQQVLQQRDIHTFKKALLQLNTQDAHIFCLRHIEGYSYQEIASAVNISESLVGVTLHRAQLKLSKYLGESQSLGENHVV